MADLECGFDDVPGGASGAELLSVYGPTILVDIGFDPTFQPTQDRVPMAGITGIRALVDTGAAESCIDSRLAAQLNLPVVDRKPVSGVHGSDEVNIHVAQIHVPDLGHTIYGSFAEVHLVAGGQVHWALIGRTFLRRIRMTYDGTTGKVTISN